MFSDVEKTALYVFYLFHGVISAYVAMVLASIPLSEAYFVVLVIFCAAINSFVVRILAGALMYVRLIYFYPLAYPKALQQLPREAQPLANRIVLRSARERILSSPKIFVLPRNIGTLLGFVVVSVVVGFVVAAGYDSEIILRSAYKYTGWLKYSNKNELDVFIENYANRTILDGRAPIARSVDVYVRVYLKNEKVAVEGRLYQASLGTGVRHFYLSPACKVTGFEDPPHEALDLVEGPGFIVNLDDSSQMELIDKESSRCFQLFMKRAT